MNRSAPRREVGDEHERSGGVRRDDGEAGAGDTERRDTGEAEDQHRRARHMYELGDDDHAGRNRHRARAAQDIDEDVHGPDEGTSRKNDERVGDCRLQHRALCAHRRIKRWSGDDEDQREQSRQRQGNDDCVRDEGVGILLAAGAEGAGDRGRHAAAHGAGRHRLHQKKEREHQRDPGERIGAEEADEIGIQRQERDACAGVGEIRCRETEQRRQDRLLDQAPDARARRRGRRCRREGGRAHTDPAISSARYSRSTEGNTSSAIEVCARRFGRHHPVRRGYHPRSRVRSLDGATRMPANGRS